MSFLPQSAPRGQIDKAQGSTVQMVVEALAARMASGDYPPGSRLPAERQLAESLKVARNTLREALDILEVRGLIMRRAGAGSFVTEPGGWDGSAPVIAATGPLHLQVMRGILEPEMARLAIVNMPPATIEALSRILDQMHNDADPAQFARHEEEFHLRLAEGTGNPLLVACYNLVVKARRQPQRAAMLRRHMTPERIRSQRESYAALVGALTARDIPHAMELVQQALLEEQRLFMQED
ncbi:FadR/GntR family transcriptional regulator [Paracoccus laeviglucosivorans]|uniref:Transcriptional regulator, GntR family n=1 Tax=Paracoccus laeviglucosivorans TaxID=1197861 RepID=A0A521FAN4_9RHOB|nr:GntR family transcriptional regulator [Paracoccus laeviglucosivorans]SMO92711.1 transcriptional regulator, GntR family [Paracoccus laeviglucosivorans]